MKLSEAMKQGYAKRLKIFVGKALAEPPEKIPTGAGGVLHFCLGTPEMRERAEKVIQRTANWFTECPIKSAGVPRSPQGECDFAANRLARMLVSGTQGLSEKTRNMLESFFLENNFESHYKSENHMLIFHVSRYAAARYYSDKLFRAYGKTGAELAIEDKAYLTEFLQFRGRHGWAEFDSTGYTGEDMAALLLLYDCAEEPLKTLARMSLDQLLLDMLADSMGSFYCGAHGRIYEGDALNFLSAEMVSVYSLYFGGPYFGFGSGIDNMQADIAMTGYMPSDYVFAAAAEKPVRYENFEAAQLHSISREAPQRQLVQEKGHISKYVYITPDYALGGVCFQDEYENPEAAWYAHHQQHEWELTFAHDTEARVFTHHPGAHGTEGAEHGYWTGDLECCCGAFYSNKNKALAMYDIPEGEEHEINANILFELYEIKEDGSYIFLKYENAYAMLYFSEGYYHKAGKYENRELRSKGKKHAVVCEAGTKEEHGSFDGFISYIKQKPIMFDKQKMSLEYDNMYMDKTARRLNGRAVCFPFPLFKNPFMFSELGSGIIKVKTSLGETTLDFNNITITTGRSAEGENKC